MVVGMKEIYVNSEDSVPSQTPEARPEPTPSPEEWATLRRAFAIGMVSFDDGWFAADAEYGYDEAEATMADARVILARFTEPPALEEQKP
jgi:hypothetical protein